MNKYLMFAFLTMACFSLNSFALDVQITGTIDKIEVKHGKKMVTVERNQDQKHLISPAFAKTSRKCPPFCAQPMHVAPGVETFGEVEVIT